MEPRLLNTTSLTFAAPSTPTGVQDTSKDRLQRRYVILYHRWLRNSDHEVLHDDILSGRSQLKPGFVKMKGAAKKAREDGFDWMWIDTCCIDKRSSAELTGAINSMYRWYQEADCCYAYLQDVGGISHKTRWESKWFERGCTLQELIAPQAFDFFDVEWTHLGSRKELAYGLWQHTGIPTEVLEGQGTLDYSIAQKMSWAANRTTTRPEDIAYSLLGIFDANMVPIYGEGEKAFIRLQEEIIRHGDDQSIFAWTMEPTLWGSSGLLAPSPRHFRDCSSTVRERNFGRTDDSQYEGRPPFSTTNRALSINLEITPWATFTYLAFIHCLGTEPGNDPWKTMKRLGIFLRCLHYDDEYVRINFHGDHGLFLDRDHMYSDCIDDSKSRPMRSRQLFVLSPLPFQGGPEAVIDWAGGFRIIVKDYEESRDDAAFRSDAPCQLRIVDIAKSSRFSEIAVGFNFDLDPVCLLIDRDAAKLLTPPVRTDDEDQVIGGRRYKAIAGQRHNKIEKDGRVYRRMHDPQPHDGIWRLHCHRSTEELEVTLVLESGERSPRVCIRRPIQERWTWEVELEHID